MFVGKKFWLLPVLYVNSVALGVISMWFFASPSEKNTASAIREKNIKRALDFSNYSGRVANYSISHGDQLFLLQEYERAISHYREVMRVQPEDLAVEYRIALALEASKRLNGARETYRKIAISTPSQYLKRASQLGIARTDWKLKNPRESRLMLSPPAPRRPVSLRQAPHNFAPSPGA